VEKENKQGSKRETREERTRLVILKGLFKSSLQEENTKGGIGKRRREKNRGGVFAGLSAPKGGFVRQALLLWKPNCPGRGEKRKRKKGSGKGTEKNGDDIQSLEPESLFRRMDAAQGLRRIRPRKRGSREGGEG